MSIEDARFVPLNYTATEITIGTWKKTPMGFSTASINNVRLTVILIPPGRVGTGMYTFRVGSVRFYHLSYYTPDEAAREAFRMEKKLFDIGVMLSPSA